MIYIEKGDKVLLPTEFHSRHNICVVLYDLMLSVGKDKTYKNLTVTGFPLGKGEKKTIDEISKGGNDAMLEYLVTSGRKSPVILALAKNVFNAILADFLGFIYESLSCARRGKMSVAYNLLRKPLTDELLILEQLLIDREDFIERFHFRGDPKLYDPSAGGSDKIKKIIQLATAKIEGLSSFFNDSIYEFRYDKSSVAGFNGITNHAHHIVTTDKNYKTGDKTFNFVFSTSKDSEKYWHQYYQILPYLLAYSSCVVDSFVHGVVNVSDETRAFRNLKRYVSVAFWSLEIGVKSKEVNLLDYLGLEKIVCRKCGQNNSLKEADFKLFYETDLFLCVGCLSNLFKTSDLPEKLVNFFKVSPR